MVMAKLGFGIKWRSWIMNCVSSASLSILLNGSPLKPFRMEKGLRQGDRFSPYLFILVSEALVYFLKKAEEVNLIEAANHALYLGVRMTSSGARETATIMGCSHSSCPFTYLGFPLGDHMNRRSAWKPVIEKIQNRLASWKATILSRADRLTLIKSVLHCLPVYYMSIFKMPKSIAKEIVSLQRKFFWNGASSDSLVRPRVKWSDIALPKEMGGLGVGNIMHKNLTLLFKWWWRFSRLIPPCGKEL
ncbi:uncharacterized protein LOC130818538 [Amaranthus tricolor]|uniref:uncharacterized protein LOC130818538 n=1 Tax=Amaranthus tricolor TaxID=29722 RepID=UPI0025885BF8|nr:uncharacterized protein LOC130818538 [Amaranthus tricolor]